MKLSVIIPVYNEAATVAELLSRVRATSLAEDTTREILIVDDGSDRATKVLLNQAAAADDVQLFSHSQNQGKGAAVRLGLQHAIGDVAIIQDADLEYFPEDYAKLLEIYQEQNAQAVYGVRDLACRTLTMRWGNRLMTWVTNRLYGGRLHDMETCYKLIDRPLMQSLDLKSRGFELEAEITAKLLLRGIKIHEAPIRYAPRSEGKKLTVWDSVPTLGKLISLRVC